MNKTENLLTKTRSVGDVIFTLDYLNGKKEKRYVHNTLLLTGKLIAQCLTNQIDNPFGFYISQMIFGTGGTLNGTPKLVDESRTGLFSTTLLSQNVISSIDPANPNTAIFTAVVPYNLGNGNNLNEMALQMENGQLYSMITFADLGKTSQLQVVVDWSISIL